MMNFKSPLLGSLVAAFLLTGCEDHRIPAVQTIQVTPFASGLAGPIGLEKDAGGHIWVAEAGSGQNDGRISMLTPDGKAHPVITGFDSEVIMGGELNGLNHILFADGVLYILGAHSKLYKANVVGFKPGDTPMLAKDLPVEDMQQFILDYNFAQDTQDTHLYNMTVGPNGDLYFTDAGANALIRRTKAGVWSVFAVIPGITNPTPVGPPFVESVPTGIVFDGQKFLVSTLLGFPFPANASIIYQVDQAGAVSVYQGGFTSLVDINLTTDPGALVVQHGVFGAMGFAPNTGQIRRVANNGSSVAVDGLNLPTDLVQMDAHTYYVSGLDGNVQKVTY
ncbi:ScyD/ScyE family protein [Salmonirosea aquatica]